MRDATSTKAKAATIAARQEAREWVMRHRAGWPTFVDRSDRQVSTREGGETDPLSAMRANRIAMLAHSAAPP